MYDNTFFLNWQLILPRPGGMPVSVKPVASVQEFQQLATSVNAVQPVETVANNIQAGDDSIQQLEASCLEKDKKYKVG